MFIPIVDDAASTIPDDALEMDASYGNNMKHQWMHGSERITPSQRPSSQDNVNANKLPSWETKPVANIELIP